MRMFYVSDEASSKTAGGAPMAVPLPVSLYSYVNLCFEKYKNCNISFKILHWTTHSGLHSLFYYGFLTFCVFYLFVI